jgi:hypothetical protein
LVAAASAGHEDLVNYLLDRGADIDSVDREGRTAFSASVASNRVSIAQLLLAKGANPRVDDSKLSLAIAQAAKAGGCEMLRFLHQSNLPINIKDHFLGTPLCAAASAGRVDAVNCLIELGATVRESGRDGYDAIELVRMRIKQLQDWFEKLKLEAKNPPPYRATLPVPTDEEIQQIIKPYLEIEQLLVGAAEAMG